MTGVAIPPTYGPREFMPAEHFAANAWKTLDLTPGKIDAMAEAYEKITADQRQAAEAAALRLIEDPALRPLLEYLTDITLRRPVVLGYGPHAMEVAREREGANRIVWHLFQMIAMARGETPPYREGT